ncbi:tetratricopeptide repeat protein [Sphingopyxis sp. L1A2A]|uniref:M48 family metalloprotease n=1 Tax=Sphingopyxis sp. L1A2A TaxID=2502247 RepID=UPI002015E987|nr:tetratricopeptide repeat protein [Sphingopyxis sp. L1A2A]
MVRLLAAVAAMATLGAANPEREFDLPTYTGAYQPQNVDERGMWMVDDESERLTRDSRLVIRDEALNNYVHSVLCRAVGNDRCGGVRIYILRVPVFNANMSPNGTMRVYSGLLLRMRNEAELASILGHEFAHFEMRHSLDEFRRKRSTSDLLAWTAVLGTLAATYGGGSTQSYGDFRISVYGALFRFSRDQEREADILGFSYMAEAKYRPSAASEVWRSAMNEADATSTGRALRGQRYDKTAFFATHPTNLERADYLSALANRVPGGEYEGRNAYQAALAPWLDQFLEDQIKLNDFAGTEYLITRLGAEEWTAPLLLARAELYRLRANPRDLPNAVEFYRQALTLNPDLPTAYRGMGLSLMRMDRKSEATPSLSRYLELKPDALDADMIRSLVAPQ